MTSGKKTVVILSTQSPLVAALERHFHHFGVRIVVLRDVNDFHRRVVTLRPTVLVVDEWNTKDVVTHIAQIRAHPVCAKIPILVLCTQMSPDSVHALHHAGSNDIMLTSHHTPRDIAARVQALLSL